MSVPSVAAALEDSGRALAACGPALSSRVVQDLSESCFSSLRSALDVPRLYRRTNKVSVPRGPRGGGRGGGGCGGWAHRRGQAASVPLEQSLWCGGTGSGQPGALRVGLGFSGFLGLEGRWWCQGQCGNELFWVLCLFCPRTLSLERSEFTHGSHSQDEPMARSRVPCLLAGRWPGSPCRALHLLHFCWRSLNPPPVSSQLQSWAQAVRSWACPWELPPPLRRAS